MTTSSSPTRPDRVRARGGRWRAALERGAASAEAVILAPGLFLIFGLILAVGNVELGEQAVETASHAAARSASLATSAQDAESRVTAAFTQELKDRGRTCNDVSVVVGTEAFSTKPGTDSNVRTTITCTMPYASVIPVPGLPGSKTITVSSISPLDTYRERG